MRTHTHVCVCAFVCVCANTRLFCRDRWLIEYGAVGGWGCRENLGAVRADGRWEELLPVRPKDGFSTSFLWEQNSEIIVGKSVAERSSGCVYYYLFRRCTFMDIAVNTPVVVQGFQLQSTGLIVRGPRDNNDAVLENGHDNIIPVF